MERAWRTAYASVAGTSHTRAGTPCQDAGGCRLICSLNGVEVLLAAVSDGAGSAALSREGSYLAVRRFLEEFGALVAMDPDFSCLDRSHVLRWFAELNAEIVELADQAGQQPRDYACTFLGALVGPAHAAFMQVGDGAIIASGFAGENYDWVFWPQHGEYANQTNFITMGGLDRALEFSKVEARIEEVALFSDGIERLVLDFAQKKVHSPAFRPIFRWLADTDPGCTGEMSNALLAYLASDHVNSRTDDDKTLVMATRALPRAGHISARVAAAQEG